MSLDWQNRHQYEHAPDRVLRRMTPDDIPAAVALLGRLGWGQQAADWARLLHWSPDGCFALEEAERGIIGTISTTPYGTALGWIGMLVIDPERQRQGFGRQLMRAALDHLIARDTQRIMLDATDMGRPLYRSLGFRELYKVERWEGRASTYLGARARQVKPGDLADIIHLDIKLFGTRRTQILIRLLEEFPDLAWVDYQRGQIEGYLLGRTDTSGVYLGPWMAWTSASAERLLLVAMEQLQGMSLTLNIPDHNGRSMILASDHNLRRIRHCTRMIYGEAAPLNAEPLSEFSVAALATG